MPPLRTVPRFSDLPDDDGHYESFYLKACHPRGGRAVWVRYTVHKRPGAAPVGSLWCTLFDADAPAPVAAKATLPPEALGTGPDHYLHVGASRFAPGVVVGAISDGHAAGGAAWDLRFKPGGHALDHLPHAWMYSAPLPRTKPRTLYPGARFSGTVSADGRILELDGWPGMVGHNWGSEHAARWIWLHAAFPDRGGAWLDLVAGRIALGRALSPWVAYGAVELDGARLPLGGRIWTRGTAIRAEPGGCDVTVPGSGLVLRATVTVPGPHMVAWEYADPGGGVHHALNCSIADVGVVVERRGTTPVELAGSMTAAYELGLRERDHGVPLQPFPDG